MGTKVRAVSRILLDPEKQSSLKERFIAFARTRVAEQDRMVEDVAHALERATAGLNDPRKPLGSFLFLGPSGAGKTLLVQTLAEFLFGNRDGLTRLDGQNYYDRHTVADLIGSVLGYVDSDKDPKLTQEKLDKPAFEAEEKAFLENISEEEREKFLTLQEEVQKLDRQIRSLRASKTAEKDQITELEVNLYRIKRKIRDAGFPVYDPEDNYWSILLLDEVGRAYKSFCDSMLKIIDEARLEQSASVEYRNAHANGARRISFQNCFVFATANEGWDEITQLLHEQSGGKVPIGFKGSGRASLEDIGDEIYSICYRAAQKKFGTPFLNRFRKVTAARPLTRKGFEKAFDIEIARLHDLLVQKFDFPIVLVVSKAARRFLVDEATDKLEEQARLIGKKIEHHITDKLAVFKLTEQLSAGDVLEIHFRRPRKLLFYKRSRSGKGILILPKNPSRK